jgi:hypothetical protein
MIRRRTAVSVSVCVCGTRTKKTNEGHVEYDGERVDERAEDINVESEVDGQRCEWEEFVGSAAVIR